MERGYPVHYKFGTCTICTTRPSKVKHLSSLPSTTGVEFNLLCERCFFDVYQDQPEESRGGYVKALPYVTTDKLDYSELSRLKNWMPTWDDIDLKRLIEALAPESAIIAVMHAYITRISGLPLTNNPLEIYEPYIRRKALELATFPRHADPYPLPEFPKSISKMTTMKIVEDPDPDYEIVDEDKVLPSLLGRN